MVGARFDADGFCIAHPKTRLCRLADDGKYKIVRKTCQRCGSAGLMTDPRTLTKATVHGYKKKPSKHRDIQGKLTASGGNHRSEPHRMSGRLHSHSNISKSKREVNASNEHDGKLHCNNESTANPKTFDSSQGREFAGVDAQQAIRRSRTLSPARRIDGSRRGRTLSPVNRKNVNNTTPSSYLRKVSKELSPTHIKKVMHSKFLSSKVVPNDTPFDKEGYCNIHSTVQLAKQDKKGSWKVIQLACPECVQKHKLQRSRSLNNKQKDGQKVSHAIKQMKISEKAKTSPDIMNKNAIPSMAVDTNNVHTSKSIESSPNETALVLGEKRPMSKSSVVMEKVDPNTPLTRTARSPDSAASHLSPAFSSTYFSGVNVFPALPLISDELNVSYADTVKHSNALVASKSARSKPRTAVPSANWLK